MESPSVARDRAIFPRAEVSLHLVGEEGILLDALSQRLYRLNTTGAFIWCCVEEDGASPAKAVARLQQAFGTTDRDARTFVDAAIAEWSRLGLIAGDERSPARAAAPSSPEPTDPAPNAEPFLAIAERHYRLLDTDFRMRFASHGTAEELHRFLAPLAENRPATTDPVIIDVRESGRYRALCHGDRVIERWAASDELVPVAKIALVTFALERSRDFGALHAGAVCRRADGPCVIIAGASGAGKSTLVAGLATSGLLSLGDDTVVLASDTLSLRAIPFGICLKQGAWELLSSRIPGLDEQPVHQRLDGKRVRYFVPGGHTTSLGRGARNSACAVVFPHRTTSGPADLVRLPPADALTRLASEFCPLGGHLDARKVERLIEWVSGMTCLEMRYSTLEDGLRTIGELCP